MEDSQKEGSGPLILLALLSKRFPFIMRRAFNIMMLLPPTMTITVIAILLIPKVVQCTDRSNSTDITQNIAMLASCDKRSIRSNTKGQPQHSMRLTFEYPNLCLRVSHRGLTSTTQKHKTDVKKTPYQKRIQHINHSTFTSLVYTAVVSRSSLSKQDAELTSAAKGICCIHVKVSPVFLPRSAILYLNGALSSGPKTSLF